MHRLGTGAAASRPTRGSVPLLSPAPSGRGAGGEGPNGLMPDPEILNLPAAEAVDHFRAKGFHVGFDWRDTDAALHVRSFTVAKMLQLDLLQDVRVAVDAALAEGTTLSHFQDALEPLLVRKGWWGQQWQPDPLTGTPRRVTLGSLARLRTIFRTNLATAYSAGRWARIDRVKAELPYLRYVAVLDGRTRPAHAAWHGTVLPVDDPWWQTHYPPNGWNCRCLVQQLDAADLASHGYRVADGPPAGSERRVPWQNRRTGRVTQVPVGLEPGWAHHVGRAQVDRAVADQFIGRLDAAPAALAQAAIGQPWGGAVFRQFLHPPSGTRRPEADAGAGPMGDWPVAVLPPAVQQTLGGLSRTVRLSPWTAEKQAGRIPGIPGHPDVAPTDYARVQKILDEGEWFSGVNRQTGRRLDRVLVGVFNEEGRVWRVAVKVTQDWHETYLTSLGRIKPSDLRRLRLNPARRLGED